MIIWLASYPKSGNTWVRSFLSAYYFTNNGIFDFSLLEKFNQFPSKDFVDKRLKNPNEIVKYWHPVQEDILKKNKIKFLKTHNALIQLGNVKFTTPKYTLGVIYVVRDPRNMITSLKNHTDISYEEALNFISNDETILYDIKVNDYDATHYISSWRMHYKSWLMNKVFKKFVIKYEDLETNAEEVFTKLLIFLNSLMGNNQEIDKNKFKMAIETTSFKNLQMKEENGEFQENVISLKTNKQVKFFNLGSQNKWEKILPEQYINKINDKFKEDLKYLKY
tara:strand:+ start:605 stop:1438 length:834 start_codon:yes stop_codon:yes gene_type:complete